MANNQLPKRSKNKIVVIGLDGATWDLIDLWIEKGHLPVLKKLVSRGTRGELKLVISPFNQLTWSTSHPKLWSEEYNSSAAKTQIVYKLLKSEHDIEETREIDDRLRTFGYV